MLVFGLISRAIVWLSRQRAETSDLRAALWCFPQEWTTDKRVSLFPGTVTTERVFNI
jgi:hypothetical protein